MRMHAHHARIEGVAVLRALAGPCTDPSTKPQHFDAEAKTITRFLPILLHLPLPLPLTCYLWGVYGNHNSPYNFPYKLYLTPYNTIFNLI